MVWFKSFVAGFLATLIFHQGLFAAFYLIGIVPAPPFNMSPVPPLGIPAVLSLAFFGGLWGLPVWALIRRLGTAGYWSLSIIAGAIGPTVVAMLVVFPLKGIEVTGQTWVGGLALNGFWGLGVALLMLVMVNRSSRPA